jgi:hypothetical protein
VFVREGSSFFILSQKRRKEKALCKRSFVSCGFSSAELRSAELNWRPGTLSSSAAQPWTPATFEKAAKAFHTGLVCAYCCFLLAPKVFFFFCNVSEN